MPQDIEAASLPHILIFTALLVQFTGFHHFLLSLYACIRSFVFVYRFVGKIHAHAFIQMNGTHLQPSHARTHQISISISPCVVWLFAPSLFAQTKTVSTEKNTHTHIFIWNKVYIWPCGLALYVPEFKQQN